MNASGAECPRRPWPLRGVGVDCLIRGANIINASWRCFGHDEAADRDATVKAAEAAMEKAAENADDDNKLDELVGRAAKEKVL